MHLYLIDGHNLLPKITGLSLSDPDDEEQLVEMLQDFSRLRRQKVEIYFDNAPAGLDGPRTHGVIRAHYLPKGQTTFDALRQRLEKLGPLARETLVVSSDRRVQSETRAHHAPFLDAELFARELMAVPRSRIPAPEPPAPVKKPTPSQPPPRVSKSQPNLSTDEVSEWMDLFKGKKKE
jgi:predicted RNA-binding protein with PIN domain